MTREEEMIIESQKRYDDIAFLDGVKWADEHPNLESLWHDASEEPKDRSHILIYYKYMGDMEFKSYNLNYQCDFKWSELVNIFEVECWTYISDLFPKGGKKLKDQKI